MLTCYIVDDEHPAISLLKKFIAQTPDLALMGAADDPLAALDEILVSEPPGLVFLDVNMDSLSGIDVLRRIRPFCRVILTTAHPKYAVSAFDLQADDFLLKPFRYERFIQAVERVIQALTRQSTEQSAPPDNSFFFIKADAKGKLIRVLKPEILYIRSVQNYIEIFLENGKHLTYLTLHEIEEKLRKDGFVRIHKSYIINLHKIRSVESGVVVLMDNTMVPIGENFREKFQKQLAAWTLISKRQLH